MIETKKVYIENINRLNDAAFKRIMTSPNNREMVVDVIHALTNIPKSKLMSATYIGGEEIPKRKIVEKGKRTDMVIRVSNNHQIIVEMNQYDTTNIFLKNTNYALSRIVENTTSKRYAKVILINIDNFNKFKTEKPILEFMMRDLDNHIETDVYKSIHLILANIENSQYNIDNELKKFQKFLKSDVNIEELERYFKGDEKYMAAIRTVKDLSTDPEFSGYYDIEEAHKWDLEDMKITGKKEQSIETAKELLKLGKVSLKEIAECTNLTIEEVKELQ